ncbi:N-acetylmuramidase family protein [Aureimonas sp. ME7]|uniref:N-acetylmuramidase family protein n=1 Tax=Aureimonas sp. ME7 TaxID=2744252 RepID=UPI0015F6A418|nr:N-acetylmuramidase family protein [Aureimonas sp. ME7]
MTITPEVLAAARRVEATERVPAPVLLAIALVETSGRATAKVGTRSEPLIRFEGHYFDRRLDEPSRRLARTAGLSSPKAGAVRNPVGQEARWRLLERAAAIDAGAAYESTSWGLGQVMGAHWRRLGFDSVNEMAALVRASIDGQLVVVARFLRAEHLESLLPAGDWKGFARRYNGPNFAANGYDGKIMEAYRKAERAVAASMTKA